MTRRTLFGPAALAFAIPLVWSQTMPKTMRETVEEFTEDQGNVRRFYALPLADQDRARQESLLAEWRKKLEGLNFASLPRDGQIDYLLLKNFLAFETSEHVHARERDAEVKDLLSFSGTILDLATKKRSGTPLNARQAADALAAAQEQVEKQRKEVDREESAKKTKRTVARRALQRLGALKRTLTDWAEFHDGYDPEFNWWTKKPLAEFQSALEKYEKVLKERFQITEDAVIGDPIGEAALVDSLAAEFIPYTPNELLAIAEREYAWCETELRRAAKDLGFGDDWLKAMRHVTTLHVPPGEQPALIRELANEAVDFLEKHDLVTIPAICKETWRMEMMTPERQKVNPYFTGGEVISVSFPTAEMDHEDKLMSLRGNNRHFCRATVQHELIPGHHLQLYMGRRHNPHRQLFSTPFLVEGWCLYWEMLLWDMGFAKSAEDRMGMLFWRTHRCARIIFSLSFHLGKMTADEAVDYLVEKVGHERRNALAEVRRSVAGNYSPLYQAAYMLGGLQFRALRKELVDTGKMSAKQFHDAILRENSIPVEMIRASLTKQELRPDFKSSWRFYEALK